MSAIGAGPSSNGHGSDALAGSWMHVHVDRRSPGYCRVTFADPPVDAATATAVPELSELVDLIEHDPDLNVVVFDSANPDVYLAHEVPPGPTVTHAWLDLLARLSRAPVVSIASIRGCVGDAGCEFVVACDLRFASRENAVLGRPEIGAREVLYVADDRLDDEVDRIARRLASFDHDAIARTKADVNRV